MLSDQQVKLVAIIDAEAVMRTIDPKLVRAIATVESALNPFVCRYEPGWSWPFQVDAWAKTLNQSHDTEYVQQSTSWGALQVMGAVAREFGFQGYLTQLSLPAVGVRYGVLKLESLLKRYSSINDVIASYNAGSPRMVGEKYQNQVYVDRVNQELIKLQGE